MTRNAREEPRVGLRSRMRYRFDNLLARGTWATLLWLGAVTLAVVALSAILLVLFQVTFTGNEEASFLEDFWQTLLRVMDPGTMAGDVGWGRRILALGVTVFGILVAGTLIGVIAAGVEDRVESMRRGRSTVVESDHVVVLGDSERLPILLRHLAVANARRDGGVIVVLADRDPSGLQEEVRAIAGERPQVRLVFRSGDPTRPADLEMTRLNSARTAIVLGDENGSDARAIKTVMAIGSIVDSLSELPLVVEMNDPGLSKSLVDAFGPTVYLIAPAQAFTRIASFALRDRGLGQVVTKLTDLEGSDIHVLTDPAVTGKTFGEVVSRYANARPIGRMLSDGLVELNPDRETRFDGGDRLILIADDIDRLDPSTRSRPMARVDSTTLDASRIEDRLQVVGWNDLGAAMLHDWATFARPGSSVEILFDSRLVTAEEIDAPGSTDEFRVDLSPTTDLPVFPAALSDDITTVLLLGYERHLPDDEADSRTLLELAALRRHVGGRSGDSPRVITHLTDPSNLALTGALGPDDFVLSDAMGSQLIAQLAEQPERRPILLEFYRPGGAEIRLITAGHLGLAGRQAFGEIFDSLYARGVIAIGWRLRERPEPLVLNPHDSSQVDLQADDEIVVIA